MQGEPRGRDLRGSPFDTGSERFHRRREGRRPPRGEPPARYAARRQRIEHHPTTRRRPGRRPAQREPVSGLCGDIAVEAQDRQGRTVGQVDVLAGAADDEGARLRRAGVEPELLAVAGENRPADPCLP